MQPSFGRPVSVALACGDEITDGEAASHDVDGYVGEAAVVVSGIGPEEVKRFVHLDAGGLADSTLGLLEEHPAVERGPQLGGLGQ